MSIVRRSRVSFALALACLGVMTASAADKYKIANEGGIREDWAAAEGAQFVAPGYPAAFASRGDDVCLALGYAIQEDGSTSDFAIIKAWSSSRGEDEPADGFWDSFAQAGAGALSQWKFKPRVVNRAVPTYTVATLTFQGKGAVSAQDLRGHCVIGDLKAVVMDKKADRFMSGIDKHTLDGQYRQMQQSQIRASAAQAARWSNGGN